MGRSRTMSGANRSLLTIARDLRRGLHRLCAGGIDRDVDRAARRAGARRGGRAGAGTSHRARPVFGRPRRSRIVPHGCDHGARAGNCALGRCDPANDDRLAGQFLPDGNARPLRLRDRDGVAAGNHEPAGVTRAVAVIDRRRLRHIPEASALSDVPRHPDDILWRAVRLDFRFIGRAAKSVRSDGARLRRPVCGHHAGISVRRPAGGETGQPARPRPDHRVGRAWHLPLEAGPCW